ncbi:hypothetical protein RJ641_013462 [Dillenia turbinata]|uniref:Uncharacterized protein n=1 Tax=Dillenia turbinata TaxID=194707 RepID=A0AAN8ZT42_9MAGN
MFKQSPSRNHRSKGIKVKHVLQICLLVAVCFWLIYQVKHSHDKKKELDENGANISMNKQSEIVKLGRKDIPHVKHVDEEEEESEAEEEPKHEEEEQEEEENRTDDGRGAGDDEIDEHDQDKADEDADHEEDFLEDEKDREEEGDEKESEEKGGEEKEGESENEHSLEDQDHDVGGRNTHEAREENYKGDDASSAVGIILPEAENADVNILEPGSETNRTEETNINQERSGLDMGEKEVGDAGKLLSTNTTGEKAIEVSSSESEDTSLLHKTEESNVEDVRSNSTDVNTESAGSLSRKTPETQSDSSQAQNGAETEQSPTREGPNLQTTLTEEVRNLEMQSEIGHSESNTTASMEVQKTDATAGESSSSSTNSDSVESERVGVSNSVAVEENNSQSSTTMVNSEGAGDEKADTNVKLATDAQAVNDDPIDSSDTLLLQDPKDARVDLDTLPEIKPEVTNNEDSVAE